MYTLHQSNIFAILKTFIPMQDVSSILYQIFVLH